MTYVVHLCQVLAAVMDLKQWKVNKIPHLQNSSNPRSALLDKELLDKEWNVFFIRIQSTTW